MLRKPVATLQSKIQRDDTAADDMASVEALQHIRNEHTARD